MHLKQIDPPYLKSKDTIITMMGDVLLALMPLYIMACFYYGLRPLKSAVISVVTCLVCDYICHKMRKMKIHRTVISSAITGLIITLLFPASAPDWIFIFTSFFAIVIAKAPFGGFADNPFNPAISAFCFSIVCWPATVFSYPAPMSTIPIFGNPIIEAETSPASILKKGGTPYLDSLELLLGDYAGAIGATCTLVILMCALYLIVRRAIKWQIPVAIIVTIAVFAFLFPRVSTGRFDSIIYELFSGIAVFGAFFIATDPVTSPKQNTAIIFYGIGIGLCTMLVRYFGAFESGFPFAVLFMNALTPTLDKFSARINSFLNKSFSTLTTPDKKGRGVKNEN